MGVVTEEQIKEALELQAQQRKWPESKAWTMLNLSWFCEEENITGNGSKIRFEFMSINNSGIDMACANLITPDIANKYKLLPIAFKDNKLLVAMQNPNDIIAIDDIELIGYRWNR